MAHKNVTLRKGIDFRLCAGRGTRNIRPVVFLLFGAFLALQCNALSIREALGMIESGDDDYSVGSAGEISRYQIKKDIWQAYSSSSRFWDKDEAWRIAEKLLAQRIERYHRHIGQAPTAFDIYVLWNAPGHFQRVGYQQERVSPVVAERAMRFANLVGQPGPETLLSRKFTRVMLPKAKISDGS